MKKTLIFFTTVILFALLLSSCTGTSAKSKVTITLSAAASFSPFLDDMIAQFEEEYSHIEVLVNYGSSGALQKQIEQGAPIDLFLSAGKLQIDRLHEKELLVEDSIRPIVTNSLVVISEKSKQDQQLSPEGYHSLQSALLVESGSFIAIAEPETAPAGIYANQALHYEQLWDKLEGLLVYGKDVREALAYVEQGNATRGIVYASDAYSSQKVNVLYRVPAYYHEPILYVGAVIEASKQQTIASQLLNYLLDERWQATYEQNGLIKVDE